MCQILSVCFLLPNVEEKAIIIVYLYTFYLFIYLLYQFEDLPFKSNLKFVCMHTESKHFLNNSRHYDNLK